MVSVSSSVIISSQFNASSSSLLQVGGTASFAPGASLVFFATQSGTFVVVSASRIDGSQFLSTVIEPAPGSCSATSGSTTVTQTTISIVVQVMNTCGGMSAGALAGIIVGSIVGAALVVTVLVLLVRYFQHRQDAVANRAIAAYEVNALREIR